MTDFVDPLEEPLDLDRDPDRPLDDVERVMTPATSTSTPTRSEDEPRRRGHEERKATMTDFVDPLEEPLDLDRDRRRPLDPDVDEALVDSAEADRQAAEDGTKVTSASEGDPMDETTPVDNLE